MLNSVLEVDVLPTVNGFGDDGNMVNSRLIAGQLKVKTVDREASEYGLLLRNNRRGLAEIVADLPQQRLPFASTEDF